VEGINNGAKNINDCPVQTINYNRTCGQSFIFFVQAKAARTHFKVLQTCGGCGRFFRFYHHKKNEKTTNLFVCRAVAVKQL